MLCERLFSLSGHVVNKRLPQQLAEYGLSDIKDFILERIKLVFVKVTCIGKLIGK